MRSLSIFSILLPLISFATADFFIYYAHSMEIDGPDGDRVDSDGILLFNEIPHCNTPVSTIKYSPDNDIKGQSWYACDGCAGSDPKNIPITRFKFYDSVAGPATNEQLDDITLYPTTGDPNDPPNRFVITYVKKDGSKGVPGDHGYCALLPVADADSWGPCTPVPFSVSETELFHCVTQLTAITKVDWRKRRETVVERAFVA